MMTSQSPALPVENPGRIPLLPPDFEGSTGRLLSRPAKVQGEPDVQRGIVIELLWNEVVRIICLNHTSVGPRVVGCGGGRLDPRV